MVPPEDMFPAAVNAVDDISGFCTRQPSVCETAHAVFVKLEAKAKYSIRLMYEWAQQPPGEHGAGDPPLGLRADPMPTGSLTQIAAAASAVHAHHRGPDPRVARAEGQAPRLNAAPRARCGLAACAPRYLRGMSDAARPEGLPEFAEVESNFAFLDDWEDRYRYLIELGRLMGPFPERGANRRQQGPGLRQPGVDDDPAATERRRRPSSSCAATAMR